MEKRERNIRANEKRSAGFTERKYFARKGKSLVFFAL